MVVQMQPSGHAVITAVLRWAAESMTYPIDKPIFCYQGVPTINKANDLKYQVRTHALCTHVHGLRLPCFYQWTQPLYMIGCSKPQLHLPGRQSSFDAYLRHAVASPCSRFSHQAVGFSSSKTWAYCDMDEEKFRRYLPYLRSRRWPYRSSYLHYHLHLQKSRYPTTFLRW